MSTHVALENSENLADLFYFQAENNSDRIAISFDGHEVTYDELNSESNRIAHLLNQKGVAQGQIVVILMSRCIEAYTSMLAIMKAGAAYLVIDPTHPTERIQYCLKDSSAACVITHARYLHYADGASKRFFILADQLKPFQKAKKRSGQLFDLEDISNAPASNPCIPVKKSDLAYVIYTSGSTGNPKGVMIEHYGAINIINWAKETFNLTHHSRIAQGYSITFDASIQEIWAAFGTGATLYPVNEERRIDPQQFLAWLKENAITYWDTVPTLWYQMVDYIEANRGGEKWHLPDLETLVLGGEALHGEFIQTWMKCVEAPNRIVNIYGPTEATVSATFHLVTQDDSSHKIVPIGRGLPNLNVSICDEALQPCPVGVKGEVCISGDGLARGYLNREALTEAAFVCDPQSGQRVYRTGDLGICRVDGVLEFAGRKDDQVKIRGYRIELAEIESVLQECLGVHHAVVGTVNHTETKTDRLVAYYLPSDNKLTSDQIRTDLKQKLPSYMIPHHFIQISTFPLTASGKVDKAALAQIAFNESAQQAETYQPPVTKTEKLLAQIWKDVLTIDTIGINDDFFAFGGDSISSIMIRHKCEQAGIHLQVVDIFQHPTISQLAQNIDRQNRLDKPSTSNASENKPKKVLVPLSSEQKALLPANTQRVLPLRGIQKVILSRSLNYTQIVNQEQLILQCEGSLDEVAFQAAIDILIARHEVLRMVFRTDILSEPLQIILSDASHQVEFRDISASNSAFTTGQSGDRTQGLDGYIQRAAETELQHRLDLTQAPLLRFLVCKKDDKRFDIVWTRQYVIMDGWSTANLIKELGIVYSSLVNKKPLILPSLSNNFSDVVAHALDQPKEEVQQYWQEELVGMRFLKLPRTYTDPTDKQWVIHGWSFSFSKSQTEQLKQFSKACATTINTVCLSAYYLMLNRITSERDLTAGVVVSGRTNGMVDVINIIGSLMNVVPLRIGIEDDMPFEQHVGHIKQKLVQTLKYSDLDVLDIAKFAPPNEQQLPFETIFVFENYPSPVRDGASQVQSFEIKNVVTKGNTDYPLMVVASEEDGQIHIRFKYAAHLFSKELMQEWSEVFMESFSQILSQDSIVSNPSLSFGS